MLTLRNKQYNNTSGYRGVFKSENKWIARTSIKNHRYYLGSFITKEEAYSAIQSKLKELTKVCK